MKKLLTLLASLLLFTGLIYSQPVPTDGATGVFVITDFQWSYDPPNSTDYYLQVSEDDFTSTNHVINKPLSAGQTSYTFNPTDLINSHAGQSSFKYYQTYYWRIRYYVDASTNGVEEGTFSFTTTPLISPINSITGVSIQPTFEFASGTTVLQISTKEDNFNTPENGGGRILSEGVSGTSFTLTEDQKLANNRTYYWRAKYNGDWYGPWYFKTYSNVNITQYNPAQGAKVYTPDMTMFTWGVGTYNTSLTFDLQYKISDTKPVVEADWVGATKVDCGSELSATVELYGGSKYYWRLIAKYNGKIVKYSSTKYFTTAGGAVKPIPSYPTNSVDVYTLTPTFYWYTMTATDDLTFNIKYWKDGDAEPADNDPTIEDIEDIYYEFETDLSPGTKYHWRVQSFYNGEPSAWSSKASFKTKGEGTVYKPVPSYPVSNAKLYTLTPTFYWYIGAQWDGVVQYDLHIYKSGNSPDNSNLVTTTTELYFELTDPLEAGASYKWKVRAHNNGSNPKWSNEASFRTEGGGNTKVILTFPKNNQLIYTFTPTLGWYLYGSNLGLEGYQLKYKKVNTKAEAVDWDNDGTLTTIEIDDITQYNYSIDSDLDYGSIYKWAVAAFDENDARETAWAYTTFRTPGNNKAKVNLSAPANKKETFTVSPTLMWYVTNNSAPIDHYRVSWSNAELFNSPETEIVTTEENMFELTELNSGSTYYWKVEVSYDGSTYETEGNTWEFYTPSASGEAVMPLVGSPANGVTIEENSPVLSWYLPTLTESDLSYDVEFADNPEFNDASIFNNISDLQAQVSDLQEGEYYWRVRSKTSNSTSFYSNTGNFKVGDNITSVDNESTPVNFSIYQNYPNPFNPTTTINYSLPKASHVNIKIYNMLGQEVKTLISKEMKAGTHSVNWAGDNNYRQKVSSGTYIYQITAGEFMQARKMILMK